MGNEMTWVYCSDKLPDTDRDVLVTVKRDCWTFVSMDSYSKRKYDGWLNHEEEDGYKVIAWMEMPEAAEVKHETV